MKRICTASIASDEKESARNGTIGCRYRLRHSTNPVPKVPFVNALQNIAVVETSSKRIERQIGGKGGNFLFETFFFF